MTTSGNEPVEATVVESPFAPVAPREAPGPQGVSLASLFVLTAIVAVLMSGVAPVGKLLADGDIEGELVGGALAAGLFGGAFLGAILGMHRYARGRGLLIGAAVGAFIGGTTVPIAVLPEDLLSPVALAMFIGSLLIVAVAFFMRPSRR